MIELIKRQLPDFSHFEESELLWKLKVVGYQSVLVTKLGYPYAGGTASNLNEARRICTAEALERCHFELLKRSSEEERSRFLIDQFPTSCGFAAGFEERPTIFRAICEAVERWAWSSWIDFGFHVPEVPRPELHEMDQMFADEFTDIKFFSREFRIGNPFRPEYIPEKLEFCVAVGFKNGGVFPGSRVTTKDDDKWTHPLLEAWRHNHIFENELKSTTPANIFDERILNFGKNGKKAQDQWERAAKGNWSEPNLQLLEKVENLDGYFVWRALCRDFRPWDEGDSDRFIY